MEDIKAESFPLWSHYLFATTYLTVIVLGISINGMSVYIFIKKKQLGSSTDVFLMCLCFTGLIMAGMGGPLVVSSAFARHWLFSEGGCSYYAFIVCFMSYINIGIVTAIAVDRYIVMATGKRLSLNKAWCSIIGFIINAFLWAVAPILGWGSYRPEGMQTSCSVNWESKKAGDVSLGIALLVCLWLVPMIIIIVCYSKIFLKNNKYKKSMSTMRKRRLQDIERDVLKTGLLVIGAFAVAWTPYAIVSAWTVIGNHGDMPVVIPILAHLTAKFSVVYHPIIYLKKYRRFRVAFLLEFRFLLKFKCFKSKIAPVITVQNYEPSRRYTTGALLPRGPTLDDGRRHVSVFELARVPIPEERAVNKTTKGHCGQPVPTTSLGDPGIWTTHVVLEEKEEYTHNKEDKINHLSIPSTSRHSPRRSIVST